MKRISEILWKKEANEKFGNKPALWLFICPECGGVQCAAMVCKANTRLDSKEVMKFISRKCYACDYSLEKNSLLKHSTEVIMSIGTVPVFEFFDEEDD